MSNYNYKWFVYEQDTFTTLLLQKKITGGISAFLAGLRNLWEQVQHISRAGPSSFHCSGRFGDDAALPGPKMQQAHCLWGLANPRQVGDGAYRYHHEAQARRRPVWRGLCGCLEEIQPHCCCQNAQGLSQGILFWSRASRIFRFWFYCLLAYRWCCSVLL